jgi:ACS family allantoate permease-like MFS transporter
VGRLLRHSTAADTVSSNHVPWLVIGICSVACIVLLFSIRLLFARENKRRDAEPPDYSYDDVYVTKIDDEGKRVEVKVSKVRVCFQ